jgi:hypothetical protein
MHTHAPRPLLAIALAATLAVAGCSSKPVDVARVVTVVDMTPAS